ncbi:hypothetical protein [Aureimonas pseudogalii]|uniref:Uncharacterized protein n=1 Tax=Aureimonas pseudogalii TaxID=1744844 RepID=A0A7W6EFA3_9HYPH|nr:hypothetical protein [Aureimonas pseudogalii]MBB3997575.1 hypothetical protein [Aureimonas pseudogalii]
MEMNGGRDEVLTARSDRIVRALVFVALPSIVWLFVLSGAGTVFFVLSLWPSVGSVVSTKAEISNLGATLFVLGFFSVGPAGLWALTQLVRVLRVRLYEGREGLQSRRRTLVVGLCVGIVPLVYLLWKATVDRYGLTTETPAPGILLWLIASGGHWFRCSSIS